MKQEYETEIHQGVGMIWHEDDGWYFQTIYGEILGPANGKETARRRMECAWMRQSKLRADVNDAPATRVSAAERALWAAQKEMIRRCWK